MTMTHGYECRLMLGLHDDLGATESHFLQLSDGRFRLAAVFDDIGECVVTSDFAGYVWSMMRDVVLEKRAAK
jgi:hypothetical protein